MTRTNPPCQGQSLRKRSFRASRLQTCDRKYHYWMKKNLWASLSRFFQGFVAIVQLWVIKLCLITYVTDLLKLPLQLSELEAKTLSQNRPDQWTPEASYLKICSFGVWTFSFHFKSPRDGIIRSSWSIAVFCFHKSTFKFQAVKTRATKPRLSKKLPIFSFFLLESVTSYRKLWPLWTAKISYIECYGQWTHHS